MKTLKKLLPVLSVIFFFQFSEAQQIHYTTAQWMGLHKQSLKDAQFIFEGTVIQQKRYYGKHPWNILTCNVVQITKIFKGNLKIGTIKVITAQGGQVDEDGPKIMPSSDGGDLGLAKGRFIIFGMPVPKPNEPSVINREPLDSNALMSIVVDNAITLNMTDVIIMYSVGARWWDSYYKATDSLYSFFKENGLTVQEEVEQK